MKVEAMVQTVLDQADVIPHVKLTVTYFQKYDDVIMTTDKSTVEIDHEVNYGGNLGITLTLKIDNICMLNYIYNICVGCTESDERFHRGFNVRPYSEISGNSRGRQ